MIKKITLAVLAVMFVFVFSSNAIAQKGSTDKEAEAIKAAAEKAEATRKQQEEEMLRQHTLQEHAKIVA